MPRTHRKANIPDLIESVAGVSTPRSRLPSVAAPKKPAEQRRFVLPNDLAGALSLLDDDQLHELHRAVNTEAGRRGKQPVVRPNDQIPDKAKKKLKTASSRKKPSKGDSVQVPRGQANLIRAAFNAGIKPGAISRQLGISLSVVRRTLAIQKTKCS